MRAHSDIILNHDVFKIIDENKNIIDQIIADTNVEESCVNEVRRISLLMVELEILLKNSNTDFISRNLLDNLRSPLNDMKSSLINFRSSHNESYLDNARSYADRIIELTNLNQYYFNRNNKVTDELTKGFNNKVDYEIGALRNSLKETIQENKKLKDIILQQKDQLDKIKEDWKNTISNNQTQIDNNLQQLRDNNNKFISDAENKIKSTIGEYDKNFDLQTDKYKKLEDDFNSSVANMIKVNQDKLNKYEEEVKNTTGYVNTTMFAYKYKQVADDSKNRSFVWNGVTAASLIGAIWMAGKTLDYITQVTAIDNLGFAVVARGVMIIMLVSFTVYCAKQAEACNKVERYARKIEMELTAFDTFIDSLEDKDKTELKKAVVERIFINREDIIDEHTNPADSLELVNQLKDLVNKQAKQ